MTQTARAAGRDGLFSRALRGSAFTAGAYVMTQGLRLVSNLILTRLLFPEAFGVMALVSVVLVGMVMFSDVGVSASISQHKRGDDQGFLDTAYTIHVFRGAMLWLVTCALAWPMASFYQAPQLANLLPVAGLTLFIAGFNPTRIDTATRHLLLGRVTVLDLIAQVTGILAMVGLAVLFRSVWALVIGAIIGSLAKVILTDLFLPGPRNCFHFEKAAGRDLVHFGKWIFLSTACGFLLSQGDKAVFGHYLSLDQLGIYNIGYFLASFPLLLARAVNSRIMIPLYRDHPPSASASDFARMRRLRWMLSGGVLAMLGSMALIGPFLVDFLYDARYVTAGAIVVAVALIQMPETIAITYDQSALAEGDSRGFFLLQAVKAGLQTGALLVGIHWGGLGGALLAQGGILVAIHPAIILLARKHRAWDPVNDVVLYGFALAILVVVWRVHGAKLGLL